MPSTPPVPGPDDRPDGVAGPDVWDVVGTILMIDDGLGTVRRGLARALAPVAAEALHP